MVTPSAYPTCQQVEIKWGSFSFLFLETEIDKDDDGEWLHNKKINQSHYKFYYNPGFSHLKLKSPRFDKTAYFGILV